MDDLTSLRDNIENLDKIHQLHILKIFKKYNIELQRILMVFLLT